MFHFKTRDDFQKMVDPQAEETLTRGQLEEHRSSLQL
jgi:hypothetical protein